MNLGFLKQSTAYTFRIGPFRDEDDGKTAETGLTITQSDIQISKAGGAFAQTSDAAPTTTHDTDGYYQCPLTTTDTNTLGTIKIMVQMAGALVVEANAVVLPAVVYDSLVSGSDNLQVDAVQVSGDSTAADNLEAILDGTGAALDITTLTVTTNSMAWNSSWDAEVQSEAEDALDAKGLDHLVSAAVVGADITDNSIIARMAASGATADWDTFVNTTDSLQAIRDHIGDGTNLTEAGGDGDHLTAIDLPDQTMNITGNLSGSVGSVTGAVGSVTAQVTADVTAISGDSTAADNLEATYDGTGYTDDVAPATQSQVAAISASSASLVATAGDDNANGTDPLNGVSFVGVVTGTRGNLDVADDTVMQIDDTANAFDLVVQYTIPASAIPLSVEIDGFLNGSNDSANIQVYDHDATSWVTKATWSGKSGSASDALSVPLGESRWSSSAGVVYIRHVCTGQSNPDLNLDRQVVTYQNQTVGYSEGSVWLDTNASNTNTTSFVDGVADNPVSTIAAALTIAGNLGLKRLKVAAGSSFTMATSFTDYEISGHNYTVAFGGQDIGNAWLIGATVSGTFVSETAILEDCIINAITGPGMTMRRCFLNDVAMTANGAGNWYLNDCRSRVAGTDSPNFDFGSAVGNTGLNLRNYSGGIEIENLGSSGTDVASIEGDGNITLNANCAGGTLVVRGSYTITDNSGGSVTISDDARYDVAQVNAECDTALTDYDPPTRTEATSDKDEILTRLGTPAGASVSADIATIDGNVDSILVDTNELQTDWVDGGRLDLIVDAILVDTGTTLDGKIDTIDGIVDAILVDTDTTIPGLISGLNDLSAAAVNAEVDTALADIHLDHLLAVDYDPASKPGIATALLNELVENDLGVSRFTANALEQGPSGGGGGDATEAKQDTILANLAIVDGIVDSILVDTGTTLDGKIDTIDGIVDAILVDTGTTIPATLSGLNDISAATVNAQVVDVIRTDTATELSAIPAASPDLHSMVQFLYMLFRNAGTQTATTQTAKDDAGANIGTATVSDDGTTFTKGKFS